MGTERPGQGLELRGTLEAGTPSWLICAAPVASTTCPVLGQTDSCCFQEAVASGGLEICLLLL